MEFFEIVQKRYYSKMFGPDQYILDPPKPDCFLIDTKILDDKTTIVIWAVPKDE